MKSQVIFIKLPYFREFFLGHVRTLIVGESILMPKRHLQIPSGSGRLIRAHQSTILRKNIS